MAEAATMRFPSLDSSYRFSNEFTELLVDTLPRLLKSKAALLDFFEEAGTPKDQLAEWRAKVKRDRQSVSKFHITRSILRALNATEDEGRPARRELLRRVANLKDFSNGWDDDREQAERLVSLVREVASVKDASTWTTATRENIERQEKLERLKAAEECREARDDLKRDFYGLFALSDAEARRVALRSILPRFFGSFGISTRDNPTVGNDASCFIEFESERYLVEVHWSDRPLGMPKLAPALVRLFNSDIERAVFISPSGFADGAIADCRLALRQKLIVLCHLEELVMLLEHESELNQLLKIKVTAAGRDQNPFMRCVGRL